MKFIHRIALRANAEQRRSLKALGIDRPRRIVLPGEDDTFLAFDVDEAHPNWKALSQLFRSWRVSDVVRTVFTKRESDSARWSEIGAWHHGYPQPNEDEFGYLEATYDLREYCGKCGVGGKQSAPFQMKREPKWGRNSIMQLVWIYDEIFVTPETWTLIFKPVGVKCRSVLSTKGVELKTVVQLVVETTVSLLTDGLHAEHCEECGRTKYLPLARGPFPSLRDVPARPMVRTAQYFGSGGQANQRLLVSRKVTRSLIARKIRGAWLRPAAEALESTPRR